MVYSFYKILDKNGVEIPDHWSGRRRTYDEAKKMVDGLNKNGEHRPYTMIEINGNMAQQTDHIGDTNKMVTAVEWLIEQYKKDGYIGIQREEQAKQMEKEQIIKAVDLNFNYDNNGYQTLGEQYYKETYNK